MRRFVFSLVFLFVAVGVQASGAAGEHAVSRAKAAKVTIGRLGDFPIGTVKPFEQHKIIVFRDGQGIYAISSECTHHGCPVVFKKELGTLVCPCHGARFDRQGNVAHGPAKRNLPWFSIEMNGAHELLVDKNKTVPSGTKFLCSENACLPLQADLSARQQPAAANITK